MYDKTNFNVLPREERIKYFWTVLGKKISLHILMYTETARQDRNALPEPSMITV